MKTLYVNLDNKQIKSTESIEVLNYNLLDDFFFYLGEAIVEGVGFHANNISLMENFNTPDNASDFDEILKQWEELKSILFSEKPEGIFEITLPNGYIDWLRYNNNDEYRKIYSLKYSNNDKYVVSIDIDDFYTSCIKGDLLRKIKSIVNKNNLSSINLKCQQIERTSMFTEDIGQLDIEINILPYDEIFPCGDLYKVKKDDRWGCVDKLGMPIIPLLYEEISQCGELYKVCKNEGIAFFNAKGKIIYDEVRKVDFADYYCAKKNGKWGFVNTFGKDIEPCKHYKCHNGITAIKLYFYSFWGFIDKTGVVITPPIYDDNSDGFPAIGSLVRVKRNGCFGCLNSKGEEEIPCIYDKIDICYDYTEVMIKTVLHGKVIFQKYR